MEMNERIRQALEQSEILRPPRQLLSTFGSSVVHYYVLTEPAYTEIETKSVETVIREGRITWGQPTILTPGYMLKVEGFSGEARQAFEMLATQNPNLAGILYKLEFKKEFERLNIVSGALEEVFRKLDGEIDKKGESLSTIIKGVDELWDVSLSKFIHEMMVKSAHFTQLPDFARKGLINIDGAGYPVITRDPLGIPLAIKSEIENLFGQVRNGELPASKLKEELDRWEVFEQYQDRFFDLFTKKR
jgi:hypothetical protein